MNNFKGSTTENEIETLYEVLEKVIELDYLVGLQENTIKDVRGRIIERVEKLEKQLTKIKNENNKDINT